MDYYLEIPPSPTSAVTSVNGQTGAVTINYVNTSGALVTSVYNKSGAPIPSGAVIYISGAHGNLPKIDLAIASSESGSSKTYGLVVNTIADNAQGQVVHTGVLGNLNTFGIAEGVSLYLSPTIPGGYTTTKPSAPDNMVYIGVCTRAHPTQGSIEVTIQNGFELEELHNVKITTPITNQSVLQYDTAQTLWVNGSPKLSKGTKTIFCIDNGDFATGQAAINAASAGDTILFGAKSGGWGDLVIPANKKLSLMGLQSERALYSQVGSITFSPTTGTQILENELYLDRLFITASSGNAVYFDGTAPARMRMNNCFINATGTAKAILSNNTNAASSAHFIECQITSSASANIVQNTTGFMRLYRCNIDGVFTGIQVDAGNVELSITNVNVNYLGNAINITSGLLLAGYSLIANSAANSSGIAIGATGAFGNSYNSMSVPTGTGYCVRGTGVHLYGPMVFANSALSAFNVKVQNTLTNVPYSTTFTLSP